MPTYEYQCEACNKGFIREQRITEKPLKKCPHCGKMKARRLISGGDFILKGGGWYSDLYSGPSNASKGGGSSDSGGGSSDSGGGSSSDSD